MNNPYRYTKRYRFKRKPFFRKNKNNRNFRIRKNNKYEKIDSTVVKTPGAVVPDRMYTRLHYLDTINPNIGTVGATFQGENYKANSVFPEPSTNTVRYIGYTPIIAFYNRYRIHASKFEAVLCNNENFPVTVVIWPTNTDVSASYSYVFIQQQLSNPFAKYFTLSSKGGMDRRVIKSYMSTRKLVGTKAVEYDDLFAATNASNPNDIWYWNVAVFAVNNSNVFTTGNGISMGIRITAFFEWFERLPLTN